MKPQQAITGIIIIILGLILIYFAYKETWIAIIYGAIIIAVGIVILLNKKEDVIEEIKQIKKKNGKRK